MRNVSDSGVTAWAEHPSGQSFGHKLIEIRLDDWNPPSVHLGDRVRVHSTFTVQER
jgi:hypothetical protein